MNYYVPSMGINVPNVYWIPTRVLVDKRELNVQIQLTGYRDQESRQRGVNIIDTKEWYLCGEEAEDFIRGLVSCKYNAIKYVYEWVSERRDCEVDGLSSVSFFYGATDILEPEPELTNGTNQETEDEAPQGEEEDVGVNASVGEQHDGESSSEQVEETQESESLPEGFEEALEDFEEALNSDDSSPDLSDVDDVDVDVEAEIESESQDEEVPAPQEQEAPAENQ